MVLGGEALRWLLDGMKTPINKRTAKKNLRYCILFLLCEGTEGTSNLQPGGGWFSSEPGTAGTLIVDYQNCEKQGLWSISHPICDTWL